MRDNEYEDPTYSKGRDTDAQVTVVMVRIKNIPEHSGAGLDRDSAIHDLLATIHGER